MRMKMFLVLSALVINRDENKWDMHKIGQMSYLLKCPDHKTEEDFFFAE